MEDRDDDFERLATESVWQGIRAAEERFGNEDWGNWQELAVDPRYVDDADR